MLNKKISNLQNFLESTLDNDKKGDIINQIQNLENSNFKIIDLKLYDVRNQIKLNIEKIYNEICIRQFN